MYWTAKLKKFVVANELLCIELKFKQQIAY